MMGRCALLLLVGMALQLFLGDVDASFLSYPWTICVAMNYLYILILLYAKSDSVKCLRRLYDRPAMLTSQATHAGVAHPVERHLAKVEVASSSLVTRSRKNSDALHRSFFNEINPSDL